MKALLVLKDLQPNRPDKATYLAEHKKTGLWPWTQLSASSRTVLFRWKSVIDHVDHAAPRAPGRWTRRWRGLERGRRRAGEDAAVVARAERSMRVHWFGCHRRRITGGVGEWRDGLTNGGCSMGAVRPPRQHSRPREAGAGGTTGAALGGWSKKTRG